MTTVIDRPTGTEVGSRASAPAPARRPSRPGRVARWISSRRRGALVLGPLLVLAGLWQGIGMGGSPQRIDDEGTYIAQAFAVVKYHSLGHYTYWYDHPPLGWITLGLYTGLTGAFDRYSNAILAGREAMLVAQLLSCVLLWVVARRMNLARWSSGLAVALFALSPLAVQFHRTVYLDNLATPWLLASFALALTPSRRLWAYASAGLCFAAAVLTKETSLLLLPVLVILLWQNTRGLGVRRYAFAVSGSMFVLAGVFYVVYATIKGELVPGANHVSLVNGVRFQLFTRAASGSVLDPSSLGHDHLAQWLRLDTALPVASVLAVLPMLFVRRVRAIAVGFAVLLAVMLRPGYLPVPYVIAMLPLAALLVAGAADVIVGWRPARRAGADGARPRRRWSPALPALIVVGAVAVGFTVPAWWVQQRGLFRANLDAPVAGAETWIEQNVPKNERLAVDDAFWVDLVRAGFPRSNVVWYYKIDTDSAVEKLSPNGWRDYRYIVSTQSLRSFPDAFPQVGQALANSVPVATFGRGQDRVEVRQIQPIGLGAVRAAQQADAARRRAMGPELAGNPRVRFGGATASVVRDGRLDVRAATVLAGLSGQSPVRITALPQDTAEATAQVPVRTVELAGATASEVRQLTRSLPAVQQPSSISPLTDGGLRLTWPVAIAPALRTA